MTSYGTPRLEPAQSDERMMSVHERVLELRNQNYAHTDEAGYRIVIELDEPDWMQRFVESGSEGFQQTWLAPVPRPA